MNLAPIDACSVKNLQSVWDAPVDQIKAMLRAAHKENCGLVIATTGENNKKMKDGTWYGSHRKGVDTEVNLAEAGFKVVFEAPNPVHAQWGRGNNPTIKLWAIDVSKGVK